MAGQGTYNLNEVAGTNLAEIVALCDVDATRAAPIRQRFPNARFYEDYRRMFEQKDLQAVVIATVGLMLALSEYARLTMPHGLMWHLPSSPRRSRSHGRRPSA